MSRFIVLTASLLLFFGCSTSETKPKFEAAEGTDLGTSKTGESMPDWVVGNDSVRSDTPSGTASDPAASAGTDAGSSNGGGTPKQPRAGVDPSSVSQKGDLATGGPDSKGGGFNSPLAVSDGTGATTALMVKLTNLLDESIKFAQESQNKRYTAEELEKVKETYNNLLLERIKVADEVLKVKLRSTDRQKAVELKLDAHQQLAAGEVGDHEKQMFDFADSLKNETNIALRKRYELFRVQKPITAIFRDQEVNEEEFYSLMEKLTSYYRDDAEVFEIVNRWITRLYKTKKRKQFMKVLEIAANNFVKSTNAEIIERSSMMKDRLTMGRLDFDVAVDNVSSGIEGAPEKLLEAAERVFSQQNISQFIVMQVAQSGVQLESIHRYELAKKYFELVKANLTKVTEPQLVQRLTVFIDNAMKRHDIIGKPLKVEGMVPQIVNNSFTRKELDFSSYQGKVTILFFWATANRESYQLLNQLDVLYTRNVENDVELIGVNADMDPAMIQRVMSVDVPKRKWSHLLPNNPEMLGVNTVMAKRCGIDSLPFTILLDQKGVVKDIRVFGIQLEDKIEELLGKKINRIYKNPDSPSTEPTEKTRSKTDEKKTDEKKTGENSTDGESKTDGSKKDADPKKDADSKKDEGAKKDLEAEAVKKESTDQKNAEPKSESKSGTTESGESDSDLNIKPDTKEESDPKKV